jgi:hypothetical protein
MTDGLEAGTPDSEIEQLAELLDIIDIDNVRP